MVGADGPGKSLDFIPSRLAKTASPKVDFQQKASRNRVHISIFSNHKTIFLHS